MTIRFSGAYCLIGTKNEISRALGTIHYQAALKDFGPIGTYPNPAFQSIYIFTETEGQDYFRAVAKSKQRLTRLEAQHPDMVLLTQRVVKHGPSILTTDETKALLRYSRKRLGCYRYVDAFFKTLPLPFPTAKAKEIPTQVKAGLFNILTGTLSTSAKAQ